MVLLKPTDNNHERGALRAAITSSDLFSVAQPDLSTRDANAAEYSMARRNPKNRDEPAASTPDAAAHPHHDSTQVSENDIDGDALEVERAALRRLGLQTHDGDPGEEPAATWEIDTANDAADAAHPVIEAEAQVLSPGGGPSGDPGADILAREQDDVIEVINDLAQELDRYQGIRARLEAKLLESRDQLAASNRRIQELEWHINTFEARAESADEIRREIATVEDELGTASERAHALGQELECEKRETVRLTDELRSANAQLEELWGVRAERAELASEVERLQAELGQIEHTLADLHDERTRLASQLQETQSTLREVRTQSHKFEHDLRNANNRIEKMQSVQESLGEKLVLLRAEKKALQDDYIKLDDAYGKLTEDRSTVEYEINSLRDRNRHAGEVIARAKRVFGDVRLALSQTRSRARKRPGNIWPELSGDMKFVERGATVGQPNAGKIPPPKT